MIDFGWVGFIARRISSIVASWAQAYFSVDWVASRSLFSFWDRRGGGKYEAGKGREIYRLNSELS